MRPTATNAEGPETELLKDKLKDASAELRLRSAAMDEVKQMLEQST